MQGIVIGGKRRSDEATEGKTSGAGCPILRVLPQGGGRWWEATERRRGRPPGHPLGHPADGDWCASPSASFYRRMGGAQDGHPVLDGLIGVVHTGDLDEKRHVGPGDHAMLCS